MIEEGKETAGDDGRSRASQLGEALRWAIDSSMDPAMASADWLATDMSGSRDSAIALLTDPSVTIAQLLRAKDVYKTMRIVGETSADRRLGARLYAAAIAAGLVRHGQRISSQSDAALRRAFQGLLDDTGMSQRLRDLAGQALCHLGNAGAASKRAGRS
jgi:hypothetical protein